MMKKMDLGDVGFSLSSSGVVVYRKNGIHLTFCIKEGKLNAHVTDEKTRERELLFTIPLNSFKAWVETDLCQSILQLLRTCSVKKDWLANCKLLFQHFPEKNELLEQFFEKRSGAYRLKEDANPNLLEPDGLENGIYIGYDRDRTFRGALIICKPLIVFVPVEKIESFLCLAEEFFFREQNT